MDTLVSHLNLKKPSKGKAIWFRFFKNDTGATTVNDIKRMLKLPATHENYKYIIECMEIAVKDKSLQLYYS